jgi:hypothetical protein
VVDVEAVPGADVGVVTASVVADPPRSDTELDTVVDEDSGSEAVWSKLSVSLAAAHAVSTISATMTGATNATRGFGADGMGTSSL